MSPTMSPQWTTILRVLEKQGPIVDVDGGATRRLMDLAQTHGTTQALSGALKHMEEEGLIERDVNHKRTYRIALAPSTVETISGADSAAPEEPRPEPAVDYQQLAEAVFAIAVRNLRDREDLGDAKQWKPRAERAETRVESLRDELAATQKKLRNAEATITVAEKNQAIIMSQLDRAERNTRGGYKLREHLDEGSRVALEALMRSMPAGTRGRDES